MLGYGSIVAAASGRRIGRSALFAFYLALWTVMSMPSGSATAQDVQSYRLVTGQPGSSIYTAGVGISTLVKVELTPEAGIDLDPVVTSGFLESFALLNEGEADFAVLSAVWSDLVPTEGRPKDDAAFGHAVQAIATLTQKGDRSTQLVVRRDVDERVVYEIVKVILENTPYLKNVDDLLKSMSLDNVLADISLPLHPGARRYFEEKGVLSAEVVPAEVPDFAIDGSQGVAALQEARTFVVYFDLNKATITDDGSSVLDEAEAFAQDLEGPTVWIAGYTDTTGSADYNLGLAERRADAVLDELRSRSIDAREMDVTAFGERSPWVVTADQTLEKRNRRVEILVEPGSAPVAIKN